MDVRDYEKLLGLVEAESGFRERDFALWLNLDPRVPSDPSRPSVVEARWEQIIGAVLRMAVPSTDADEPDH